MSHNDKNNAVRDKFQCIIKNAPTCLTCRKHKKNIPTDSTPQKDIKVFLRTIDIHIAAVHSHKKKSVAECATADKSVTKSDAFPEKISIRPWLKTTDIRAAECDHYELTK